MSVPEPISDGMSKWEKKQEGETISSFHSTGFVKFKKTHLCPRSHVIVRNYIYIYSYIPTTYAKESEVIWEVVEAEK